MQFVLFHYYTKYSTLLIINTLDFDDLWCILISTGFFLFVDSSGMSSLPKASSHSLHYSCNPNHSKSICELQWKHGKNNINFNTCVDRISDCTNFSPNIICLRYIITIRQKRLLTLIYLQNRAHVHYLVRSR